MNNKFDNDYAIAEATTTTKKRYMARALTQETIAMFHGSQYAWTVKRTCVRECGGAHSTLYHLLLLLLLL